MPEYNPTALPDAQAVLDALDTPCVILDADCTVVAVNARYLDFIGLPRHRVLGRRCRDLAGAGRPCNQDLGLCVRHAPDKDGRGVRTSYPRSGPSGDWQRAEVLARLLPTPGGVPCVLEQHELPAGQSEHLVSARSQSMRQVLLQLERVAPTGSTLLLHGESGTGKEHVARHVHALSGRIPDVFVVLDCANLSPESLEQELFGRELADGEIAPGLFEIADGGTLFIDQIGELPRALQTRLTRVLETGEYRRAGRTLTRLADVRIIATTDTDLKTMVEQGRFRKDLYYRIAAFPVVLPRLRDRREDIPDLAAHFLRRAGYEDQLPLDPAVLDILARDAYPGNLRELANVLERAIIYAAGEPIAPDHLVFDHDLFGEPEDDPIPPPGSGPDRRYLNRRGRQPDEEELLEVLAACEGHRAAAARRLGVSERTLYRQLKRLRDTSNVR